MKVYGQLEVAQFELLASDPSPGVVGRVFLNTTDGEVGLDQDGATIVKLVDKTTAQTITNKTLTSATINTSVITNSDIDLSGNVAADTNRVVVPSGTSAQLAALTRKKGAIAYDDDLSSFVGDDGVSGFNAFGGGGSGGFNYVPNPNATANANDWVTYANSVAGDSPDDFGGVVNGGFTFTRNTTDPLNPAGDFQLTKPASNVQGHGVYTEFDGVKAYQRAMLLFNSVCDLSAWGDDELRIFLVGSDDNFVADFDLLSPANPDILVSNKITKQIQTTNKAKYRLCVHVSTTDATAKNAFLDDVFFGPSLGGAREAKSLYGRVRLAGTQSIPDNVQTVILWDTITEDPQGSYNSGNGRVTFTESGVVDFSASILFASSSWSVSQFYSLQLFLNGSLVDRYTDYVEAARTGFFALNLESTLRVSKGDYIEIRVQHGRGAATNIGATSLNNWFTWEYSSVDSDGGVTGRDILLHARGTSTTIPAATETKIVFDILESDTAGIYNISNGEVTLPENGSYTIKSTIELPGGGYVAPSNFVFNVYRNNVFYQTIDTFPYVNASQKNVLTGDVLITDGVKDDVYDVRVTHNFGANLNPIFARLMVEKNASSQALLQTEAVNAEYSSNAGTLLVDATVTTIPYEDRDRDTHNAYNTLTGIYTVPTTGTYQINAQYTANWDLGVGDRYEFRLYVDSVIDTSVFYESTGTNTTTGWTQVLSRSVYLEKGQEFYLAVLNSTGVSRSLSTTSYFNRLSITRIK